MSYLHKMEHCSHQSNVIDPLYSPIAVVPLSSTNGRPPSRSVVHTRTAADEKLGFEAAVAALGKLLTSILCIRFVTTHSTTLTPFAFKIK